MQTALMRSNVSSSTTRTTTGFCGQSIAVMTCVFKKVRRSGGGQAPPAYRQASRRRYDPGLKENLSEVCYSERPWQQLRRCNDPPGVHAAEHCSRGLHVA